MQVYALLSDLSSPRIVQIFSRLDNPEEFWYNYISKRYVSNSDILDSGAVSFRNIVLGLLNQQPMSGYDIKRTLESLDWLVGSPSFGSLYPALHALLKDELATVEVIARPDKPTRKVYSITTRGRQTLEKWVSQLGSSSVSLKEFVMRLILAYNFSPGGLIEHLEQRRSQVLAHRDALRQGNGQSNGDPAFEQHLALEYGLSLADAELSWLDNTLDQLSQQTISAEDVHSN